MGDTSCITKCKRCEFCKSPFVFVNHFVGKWWTWHRYEMFPVNRLTFRMRLALEICLAPCKHCFTLTLLIGFCRLSCDVFQLRHFWVRIFFFVLIIALITGVIKFFSFHCSKHTQTHMLAATGTCSHSFLSSSSMYLLTCTGTFWSRQRHNWSTLSTKMEQKAHHVGTKIFNLIA